MAGLKLSQAAWAEPGRLEELAALSEADRQGLRRVFARQWALGKSAAVQEAREALLNSPGGFLAKPGRDGLGGSPHKFEDAEVLELLAAAERGEAPATGWVVMEKVSPPVHPSLVLRGDSEPSGGDLFELRPSVGELGIFAAAVADAGQPTARLRSRATGHLLRSKHVLTSDGGVCRGNAVIDTPYLVRGSWAAKDSWQV